MFDVHLLTQKLPRRQILFLSSGGTRVTHSLCEIFTSSCVVVVWCPLWDPVFAPLIYRWWCVWTGFGTFGEGLAGRCEAVGMGPEG